MEILITYLMAKLFWKVGQIIVIPMRLQKIHLYGMTMEQLCALKI